MPYFAIKLTQSPLSVTQINDQQSLDAFLKECIELEISILDKFPNETITRDDFDINGTGCQVILIHGSIQVPKKKEVVMKYEMPDFYYF